MTSRSRRAADVVVAGLMLALGLSASPLGPVARAEARPPAADATEDAGPLCGPEDDPTVGCGVRIVGSNDLAGRTNNFNLARVGDCAYVSSTGDASIVNRTPSLNETDGVAVVDVSDPSQPRLVTILRTPGSTEAGETIHAVEAGDRSVLVVGAYGGKTSGHPLESQIGPALDVYDVSGDCTAPVHRATVYWPDNVHNVTVNPSGTRVYGTRFSPNPTSTAAMALSDVVPAGEVVAASPVPLMNVLVMDITDLAHPRLVADEPLRLPDGTTALCHTVHFDEAETRMYCAGRVSEAATPDGREPPYSVWQYAGPSIWDITDISEGRPDPQIRFVGESAIKGQGAHHAVPATINGRRYIVAANELAFSCDMAAYPRIWDITDETRPTVVSELHLPPPDECAGNHYNNVDSYTDTTMVLVGWMEAGLQVFDIRDPAHPRRVAYFRPGSSCKSYVYAHEPTGHLWFACDDGFYVVELAPQVRRYMSLPVRAAGPAALTTAAWASQRADLASTPAGQGQGSSATSFYCALLTSAVLTAAGE
jgi:hypothetical protein